MTRSTRPGLLALALLVGAAACGGGDAPSTASAPSAPASSAPDSSAPAPSSAPASSGAAPATPSGPAPASAPAAGSVVVDGVRVPVPAGWRSTLLTEAAQAEAVARESDPRVATFLRDRVAGLAGQGALVYLYDFRGLAEGRLATAELYRYRPGRTPAQAVDEVVLPALAGAGLTPVRGQTVLPAGPALTLTTQRTVSVGELRNDYVVLALGPTSVGLSVTSVGPPRADTAQLAQGLAAA